MPKKHKNYKPQKRSRLKITTGQLVSYDTVYMDRESYFDVEKNEKTIRVYGLCTCGKWRTSEEATTIQKVANEAKAHVENSPGCRLRQHDVIQEQHPLDVMTDEDSGV